MALWVHGFRCLFSLLLGGIIKTQKLRIWRIKVPYNNICYYRPVLFLGKYKENKGDKSGRRKKAGSPLKDFKDHPNPIT